MVILVEIDVGISLPFLMFTLSLT